MSGLNKWEGCDLHHQGYEFIGFTCKKASFHFSVIAVENRTVGLPCELVDPIKILRKWFKNSKCYHK